MSNKRVLILLLLFSVLSGASAQDRSAALLERIIGRGVLRVALYEGDIRPLFYQDDAGSLSGHEIDLSRKIAEAMGVRVVFDREATSFDQVIERVRGGRADIAISLISRTLPRARKVLFSEPYLVVHPVILLNRRSFPKARQGQYPGILEGSTDFSIGVKKGTAYGTIAGDLYPGRLVIEFQEWDDAIRALTAGDVDVVIRDEIGVTNLLNSEVELLLTISSFVERRYNDNIAIAMPYGADRLLQWLNIFLAQEGYPIGVGELFRRYEDDD